MSDLAPAQDLEAEQAVLGAVLLGGVVVVAGLVEEGLAPGDFYRPQHARVYRVMLAMREDGEPVDALTLRDRLRRDGALDEAGGQAALDRLSGAVPVAANYRTYARVLLRLSMLRARRRLLQEALEAVVREDEKGYRDVLAKLRRCEIHYRGILERGQAVTP